MPNATKKRAPKGGWPSHCSEFVIDGEANRFRYVVGERYKLDQPPPPGKHRRVFAKLGRATALFEELPDRPV
jgi:hypothetical protein